MRESFPRLRPIPERRPRQSRLSRWLFFLLLLAGGGGWGYREYLGKHPVAPPVSQPPAAIEVYFSPDGGCTAAIISALDKAQRNILVQAYYFTSAPIAEALVRAHRRGVAVTVVLDRSQAGRGYSSAEFLHRAGIATLIDDQHAIAHNKIILIDDELVITGSFNFTQKAESSNAENVLFVRDKSILQKYLANWHLHHSHSTPYPDFRTAETH